MMHFITALCVVFHLSPSRSSRSVILIATRKTTLSLRLDLITVMQHLEYEPESTLKRTLPKTAYKTYDENCQSKQTLTSAVSSFNN